MLSQIPQSSHPQPRINKVQQLYVIVCEKENERGMFIHASGTLVLFTHYKKLTEITLNQYLIGSYKGHLIWISYKGSSMINKKLKKKM